MVKQRPSKRASKRRASKRRASKRRISICKKRLQDKIKINLHEWKQGLWKSQKQAIAVSYSQVKKKYPRCRF